MSVLLIDNYDSFTYNLYQALRQFTPDVAVFRNDAISVEEIVRLAPAHIVISPGPGVPEQAGISKEAIRRLGRAASILGVCLGHQCIGHSFGGEVVRNVRIMHGKVSPIRHDGRGVFAGLSNPFEATRYHSLVIKKETWTNPDFEVTAWTDEGEIMGVRHRTWPLHGVQFHPESFLTLEGPKLLRNFLQIRG